MFLDGSRLMPDRFLREPLLTSRWAQVSRGAQLLYIRLLLKVCDHGLYEADPKLIAGVCYPVGYRAWPKQIAALLEELAQAGLIRLYKANGKRYLQLTRWRERARGNPKFPPPPGYNVGNLIYVTQKSPNLGEKERIDFDSADNLAKSETSETRNPIKTGLSTTTVQPTSQGLRMPKPIAHMPKPPPRRAGGGGGFYKPGGF